MRPFLIALLAFSATGCNIFGPSEPLDGQWVAQTGKFSRACFTLQQNGDEISGTASYSSENFLIYSGVPVHGEYPRVTFTVAESNTEACCRHYAGTTFTGRRDSSEDIVGVLGTAEIRFERGDVNQCLGNPIRTAP